MKKFFRENFVLAAGISLPLLLVLFFWMATYLPTLFVDPPEYDFLYTAQNYNNNTANDLAVKIDVSQDQVRIRAAARWSDDNYNRYNNPKLYRFDAKTGKSVEIPFNDQLEKQVPKEYFNCVKPSAADPASAETNAAAIPNRGDCPNRKGNIGNDYAEITIPELQNVRLIKDTRAPDGYNVSYGGYHNRSLFSDVFYNSRGTSGFRIEKNGRAYSINNHEQRYRYDYGNTQFLGWIRKN